MIMNTLPIVQKFDGAESFLCGEVKNLHNECADAEDAKQYIEDVIFDYESQFGILLDNEKPDVVTYINYLIDDFWEKD